MPFICILDITGVFFFSKIIFKPKKLKKIVWAVFDLGGKKQSQQSQHSLKQWAWLAVLVSRQIKNASENFDFLKFSCEMTLYLKWETIEIHAFEFLLVIKLATDGVFGFGLFFTFRLSSPLSKHFDMPTSCLLACPFHARMVTKYQLKSWYFVTKIVLTYCEKKNVLVI